MYMVAHFILCGGLLIATPYNIFLIIYVFDSYHKANTVDTTFGELAPWNRESIPHYCTHVSPDLKKITTH
jgi:hypothetical protein